MRIPETKIEEIRTSTSIVDVISSFVQLRKRGKNYVGLCPFHQEKTPSFTVSEDKQIYHCFGCHAGGNVFKFLMDFKSISFVEAVKEVAEQVGINLDYEQGYDPAKQDELEFLYDINLLAAKYFSNNLLHSDEGETARKYFENRNIKLQTQKIFGLGYALPSWEHFLNYARENKIDLPKAKLLGLLDLKDNGDYYDKFRERVIFPIFSPNGRVIAFGGRTLSTRDNLAKYLNSPESQVYLKRKSLYGLFHSKEEIRRVNKAILVEGYMDLISLHQNGIKNVVASSGTSLTEEQVQLLSRYTKNIVVLFDADAAGEKASLRSIEILLKQDFDVKVVALPEGEDPDSFINKNSKEDFEEAITRAQNFLEYQTSQFQSKGMFDDPATQADAIRELVSSASLVSDELKRNLLIKSISRKFNLREKLIESELEKFLQQRVKSNNRTAAITEQKAKAQKSQVNGNRNGNDLKESRLEKEIVRLLYSGDEEIAGYICENITSDEIVNRNFRMLVDSAASLIQDNIYSSALLIDNIEIDELKTYIREILLREDIISKKWDDLSANGRVEKDTFDYAQKTIRNYRITKIDEQIRINNETIASSVNDDEHFKLLKANEDLKTKRKILMQE